MAASGEARVVHDVGLAVAEAGLDQGYLATGIENVWLRTIFKELGEQGVDEISFFCDGFIAENGGAWWAAVSPRSEDPLGGWR